LRIGLAWVLAGIDWNRPVASLDLCCLDGGLIGEVNQRLERWNEVRALELDNQSCISFWHCLKRFSQLKRDVL